MATATQVESGISYDTKTIIVILLLIFVYPVGAVMMFVWMKWPMWVKLLLTIPVLIIPLALLSMIVLVSINPAEQLQKARDTQRMAEIAEVSKALDGYQTENGAYPETLEELLPVYMDEVPTDPLDEVPYEYTLSGLDYELCTEYESKDNTDIPSCYTSQESVR